jgi:hypothetical protein
MYLTVETFSFHPNTTYVEVVYSTIATTESSMEIISPVKLNSTHISQNLDPISPKKVLSRLPSRQRRLL